MSGNAPIKWYEVPVILLICIYEGLKSIIKGVFGK